MLLRACKLRNWGDTLNSDLIKLITGNEPTIVNNSFKNPENETIYMAKFKLKKYKIKKIAA